MFAVATDIHADRDNLPEISKSLEFLKTYCEEKHIYHVMLLGDLFTDRTGQTQETLLFWKRMLKKFDRLGISTHIIPGNHDKTNLESEDSYVDLFEGMQGVNVYPSGGIVNLGWCAYAFMPYFKENGSYVSRMNALNEQVREFQRKHKNMTVFLGTHIAVNEVRNNDGSLVENNIKPELFKLYHRVHVGHYHNTQEIDNIWYIGSLQPQNFGEDNEKGFIVVNKDFEEERIKPDFRKFIKINIDLDEAGKGFIEKMRQKYANSKHNIRFVFKGSSEQLETIDKSNFNSVGIDVKKNSKALLKSIKAASEGQTVTFTAISITKNFTEFCKLNNIEGKRMVRGLKYIKNI